MFTHYFSGISYTRSTITGFYVIDYRGNSYYACAYRDRSRGKAEITDLMKSLKTFPKYNAGDFDFHHVVERPHLADISCAGATVAESYPGMPTVMIHKGEHLRYNRILHAGETRELYMRTKENLPSGVEASEKKVRDMLAGNDKEAAKKEIALRIDIMKDLYNGVYQGNGMLKIIAGNIFNQYKSRLNAM